jgi:hypothetical protein
LAHFLQGHIASRWFGSHKTCLSFPPYPSLCSQSKREALGNGVKPARYGFLLLDGAYSAHEYQEGCLEHIFSLVSITKYPPRNGKDHGSVPLDKMHEGRLIPPGHISLAKFTIGQIARTLGRAHPVDEAKNLTECRLGHWGASFGL